MPETIWTRNGPVSTLSLHTVGCQTSKATVKHICLTEVLPESVLQNAAPQLHTSPSVITTTCMCCGQMRPSFLVIGREVYTK